MRKEGRSSDRSLSAPPHPCCLPLNPLNEAHLILYLLHAGTVLNKDHPKGKKEHQQPMANIPKHDSKQEWKGDDGVGSCKVDTGSGMKSREINK